MMPRLTAILVAVLVAVAGPALARPVDIPSAAPIARMDIPKDWKVKPVDRGIEVHSPDDEIFFWVEVYVPAQYAAVVAEHQTYFAGEGVTITGDPKTVKDTVGPVTIEAANFPATWNGKPTILRYLAIDPALPAKNQILISYWASPAADKTFDGAFKAMLDSLGPPR